MKTYRLFSVLVQSWIVCVALVGVATAQTNSTDQATDDVDWSRLVVEAYRDYADQQKLTLESIEQARQDAAAAAAAAAQDAAELEEKLKRMEITWAAQHERDIAALEASHRFTLRVVGTFACLGFIALVLLSYLWLRAMNRRVEQVTTALARHSAGLLPAADTALVTVNAVEKSNARFLNAIEQLEQRIREMEQDAAAEPLPTNGDERPDVTAQPGQNGVPAEPDPAAARVAALLGKAQTHLSLDQFDEALACAEEALALVPGDPEAHVRKGSALEGLDRTDEALAEYDTAIALDRSLTMAYLRKGGVFNRLERYGEALACYEQALKTQQRAERATSVEG